jgi:hypothetical protein
MQMMHFAGPLIRSSGDRARLTPREMEELLYAGPRQGLKDLTRVTAAFTSVVAYAGLLAYAWQ